jgi:hypothetical protein
MQVTVLEKKNKPETKLKYNKKKQDSEDAEF